MTYEQLLKDTAKRKSSAIRKLNNAIHDPKLGFLAKAEIEKKPGQVAWHWLASDFCQTIAEHLDELMESASSYEQDDILRIYYAYYDNDPDLYELLPLEAQLFAD